MKLTLLVIAALLPVSASADVILATSQTQYGGIGGTVLGGWWGQEFQSATVATTITDVKILMDTDGLASTDALSLFSDNGSGTPLSIVASLGSLSINIPGGAPILETFIPSGPVNLAASTNYWLVMSCTSCGDYSWYDTQSTGVTGMTGANVLDSIASTSNGGSPWTTGFSNSPYFFTPLIFTIDGASTTPEPSTLFMVPIGLAALWMAGRRRKI